MRFVHIIMYSNHKSWERHRWEESRQRAYESLSVFTIVMVSIEAWRGRQLNEGHILNSDPHIELASKQNFTGRHLPLPSMWWYLTQCYFLPWPRSSHFGTFPPCVCQKSMPSSREKSNSTQWYRRRNLKNGYSTCIQGKSQREENCLSL